MRPHALSSLIAGDLGGRPQPNRGSALMSNRKLSRRDAACRAGASAPSASPPARAALASGAGQPAAQAPDRTGSHHDMVTVGQLAPGSFDPDRVPHPLRHRQGLPPAVGPDAAGVRAGGGGSRDRGGARACSTRRGPTTARCRAPPSAAPRATGSASASPTRAATRTASTSTASIPSNMDGAFEPVHPGAASSTSSTPSLRPPPVPLPHGAHQAAHPQGTVRRLHHRSQGGPSAGATRW